MSKEHWDKQDAFFGRRIEPTSVILCLQRRQFGTQDLFRFRRHLLDHVLLQSTNHELFEFVMQLFYLSALIFAVNVEIVGQCD